MPRILFPIVAVVASLSPLLRAAPLQADLGRGLVYYRVHALPADLPGKATGAKPPPCVVDVRYLHADPEAETAFVAWVKFRATRQSPVFVLANAETDGGLTDALAHHGRGAGIVVVGIEHDGFRPEVPVTSSAQMERRAYDALEQGVSVDKLLTENQDKVRNDEASLSKDRLAEASADAADDLLSGKREVPPLDAALQRAVHLHRALVALKRI